MYSRKLPSAILSQFPGQVTLRPSSIKLLYGLAFAVPLAIPGLSWIIASRGDFGALVVGSVFIAATSGVAIWISILGLCGPEGITLTADGFEVVRGQHRESHLWRDVTSFRVHHDTQDRPTVVFDRVDTDTHGHDHLLPHRYELSAAALAELLQAWRHRACPAVVAAQTD